MAGSALIAALRSASPSAPGAEDSGVTSYEMPALGTASPLTIRKSGGLLNPVDFSKQRQQQTGPQYGGYEPWYVQWLRSQSGKKGGGGGSNPLTQIASAAAGVAAPIGAAAALRSFSTPSLSTDFTSSAYDPQYTPREFSDFSGSDTPHSFISTETVPDFSSPVYQPQYTPTDVGDLSGYDPSKPFTFEDFPDFSGYTPAQSADSALAYSLNQPISIPTPTLPTYSGLKDFGSLTNAQSADAALEAALSPYAPSSPVLTSLSTEFAPVGDVNELLNQTPNINIEPTTSMTNPFGLSTVGNAAATLGAGMLGEHIWGGGDGMAGNLVNVAGSALGPIGALVAPLVGEVFFNSDLPPLTNPLTGEEVQPGSKEYGALEEFYGRNFNVPQAINTYDYSPEDQLRLMDAFYNPTDATAANVSNITQNATGLTYDPMSFEELSKLLAMV